MGIIGIYQIQSKIKPERIYIGSSVNIHKRWDEHNRSLKRNKHHSQKLQRHYNKYGQSDLQFSFIVGCDAEDLIKMEQYFIDSHKPYFNISPSASFILGHKHAEETKIKMSLKAIGNKNSCGTIQSDDQKKKNSDAKKGNTWGFKKGNTIRRGVLASNETKQKMSDKRKGIPKKYKGVNYPEEFRKKLRDAWIIRKEKRASAWLN